MKKYSRDKHINELIDNANFMQRKLSESIEGMKHEPIVVPYDNGGGQTGIRANPVYDAYNKLLKSYRSTIDQLEQLTDQKAEIERSKVIDLVGNSKWKKAHNQ